MHANTNKRENVKTQMIGHCILLDWLALTLVLINRDNFSLFVCIFRFFSKKVTADYRTIMKSKIITPSSQYILLLLSLIWKFILGSDNLISIQTLYFTHTLKFSILVEKKVSKYVAPSKCIFSYRFDDSSS